MTSIVREWGERKGSCRRQAVAGLPDKTQRPCYLRLVTVRA
ncbi:hypothetical protein HMPREF1548_06343 [Clostridium sp. KLE 1755]|nr:hypothetical protein HMPREF1548_06343 [Clostridium sp. KLE 1755]